MSIIKKNQALATALALIPGFGHLYLGLYKKAAIIWGVFLGAVLVQLAIIDPLVVNLIKYIFSEGSLINYLAGFFLSLPFWVFAWQLRDIYISTNEINYPNPRRVLIDNKRQ